MKTSNYNKYLLWAVIVLAILNFATIGTIIFNRYRFSKHNNFSASRQIMNENRSAEYSGRFFREKLNFSPEQMEKFSESNPGFRQGVRNINIELAQKRNQMLRELSFKEIDTLKLNQLADSVGLLHASLKKMTFQYYLDLKQICKPQQEKKLENLFKEMLFRDVHTIQQGKGPQNGRQFDRNGRNKRFRNN